MTKPESTKKMITASSMQAEMPLKVAEKPGLTQVGSLARARWPR